MNNRPISIIASTATPRIPKIDFPEPYAAMIKGQIRRPLGDMFGVKNFGINLTTLLPGAVSSLHHQHSHQDEMVYILEGEVTLFTDDSETILRAGMCAGFVAGGIAHHLKNNSTENAVLLEVGDRSEGDQVTYPNDDFKIINGEDGKWLLAHKDGKPY
jgi:uncharacterized cupin superfamily protein